MKHSKPGITPVGEWTPANRGFYDRFLTWLREGGYSGSTLKQYAMGARLALGLLGKPYWLIDLDADLKQVGDYLEREIPSEASRATYAKGARKLAEYLRVTCHRPAPERALNWDHHLAGLPAWLADDVRTYLQHQRRGWQPELARRNAIALLSRLATFLRWAASRAELASALNFTPELWYG